MRLILFDGVGSIIGTPLITPDLCVYIVFELLHS